MSTVDGAPDLAEGDGGEWVTYLQEQLEAAGYAVDGIDGTFGPVTNDAVQQFQTAYGLSATGVVDVATWAHLVGSET